MRSFQRRWLLALLVASGCAFTDDVPENVGEEMPGALGTGGDTDAATTADTATGTVPELTTSPPAPALGGECDPRDDRCGADLKCTFEVGQAEEGEGFNRCVAVRGTDEVGDPCDVLDEGGGDTCVVGSYCLAPGIAEADATEEGDTAGRTGICAAFCDRDDMCPEMSECVVFGEGTLPLCLTRCDPLAPECLDPWSCFDDPSTEGFYCRPTLEGQRGGAYAEPCLLEDRQLCASGFSCVPPLMIDSDICNEEAQTTGCCAALCDQTSDVSCPGENEVCLPYFDTGSPPPLLEDLGLCVVPQ